MTIIPQQTQDSILSSPVKNGAVCAAAGAVIGAGLGHVSLKQRLNDTITIVNRNTGKTVTTGKLKDLLARGDIKGKGEILREYVMKKAGFTSEQLKKKIEIINGKKVNLLHPRRNMIASDMKEIMSFLKKGKVPVKALIPYASSFAVLLGITGAAVACVIKLISPAKNK